MLDYVRFNNEKWKRQIHKREKLESPTEGQVPPRAVRRHLANFKTLLTSAPCTI